MPGLPVRLSMHSANTELKIYQLKAGTSIKIKTFNPYWINR